MGELVELPTRVSFGVAPCTLPLRAEMFWRNEEKHRVRLEYMVAIRLAGVAISPDKPTSGLAVYPMWMRAIYWKSEIARLSPWFLPGPDCETLMVAELSLFQLNSD